MQDDLVAALVRDAVDRDLALAGRILDPHAAVQVHELLRRRRVGAREHLAHLRVLRRDLLALLVGERLDVQHQRLLDLGAVEEVVDALRRDLGMLGQHDRRREHRVVVRRREHRPGVDLTAAGDAVVAALQRRDDLRAVFDAREQVRGEHALQQRVLAVCASPPPR